MKKFIYTSIFITVAFLSGAYASNIKSNIFGGRSSVNNPLSYSSSSLTETATTTQAPSVLVLSANSSRTYARITNDSDTAIYIGTASTSSINEGIRLDADGGTFVINQDNLYTGEFWATSSAASKNILITEF